MTDITIAQNISDDGSQPEMKDSAVLGISTATKFAEIFTVYDGTYFRLRK